MRIEAYWISPAGDSMPVETIHIAAVIKDPERFGITSGYINGIYNEENEEVGVEGRARERIIIHLVGRGWIRARYYPRKGSWTVNVRLMDERVSTVLRRWAGMMVDEGQQGLDEVVVDEPGRQTVFSLIGLAVL